MAANKIVRFGPVALSATMTTNILNAPTTTGGVGCGTPNTYILLRHVRVVNKTSGVVNCSFWLGATGANTAGTEVLWQAKDVPAHDAIEWGGVLRLDPADFLVGGASAGTSLTFEAEGELGIA